ncbi:MAG: glyoxalase/bleomycin resistance/extradiol dioxygenase family protein [candidate division Zixibacteria bacterium]|nr:glyoxalase/bleomycin resistance/extradiol dioxygenase family protein [candidate division Zixibacteria bacterium]
MSDAPKLSHVIETGIYIKDLKAAKDFYKDVLGLEPFIEKLERHLFYKIGNTILIIFNPDATMEEHYLPPHGARGIGHIAIEIDPEDTDAWREHLKKHDVEILKEASFGGGVSLYFHDPGQNLIELITKGSWD